ncbi:MAG TPA: PDZ domain-containing protein [Streptosporangiaceae bacterium]|jgi:PDZ domain-containing protein|nr:PDZ domain-containing protein [Streptosporangiaceae bacterium]
MSRRSLTLLIAAVGTAAAIAVSVLVSVPYVILGPGPTLNTLGSLSGKPLITITGHATYPTSGHLNMVTVGVTGGPGVKMNIFRALAAWLNPDEAVVPESEVYPSGQSATQNQQQGAQQMTGSQQDAILAALTELHIPYTAEVAVVQAVSGYPAYGVLKAGDVITAVDGKPVTGSSSLTSLIYAHPAGSTLTVTIDRNGTTRQVQVGTRESGGHPVIGVEIQEQYKFPFTVTISVGDIGGPSAGMMFALGIIDKLTTLDLTGGKFIAGTGEITAAGQVQAIGGIQQKMVGARDAGATYFLTPASNCSDTTGAVPAGLRLVKVSTLSQAVTYLEDIKAGQPVPSC